MDKRGVILSHVSYWPHCYGKLMMVTTVDKFYAHFKIKFENIDHSQETQNYVNTIIIMGVRNGKR